MSANDKIVLGLIIIGMFLCFVAILAIVIERYQKAEQEKQADDLADREEINQKILEMHDYGEFLTKELSSRQSEAMLMYEMLLDKEKKLMKASEKTSPKVEPSKEGEAKASKAPKAPKESSKEAKHRHTLAQAASSSEETPIVNHNEEIKRLYRQGLTSAEIAKKLGIGKGQVELVYHLFVEKK